MKDSSDNLEEISVAIGWGNHCFRIFQEHQYSSKSFFRRSSTCSIYSIFHLWRESNALDKSTNNSVASRFFWLYSFKDSTYSQNL